MTHFLGTVSHGLGFFLWAAVGLLVAQVARLPGKGWLTAGFLMLAARSLLRLIGPDHPVHDDPEHTLGPLLTAGAVGCCLVGVVMGGAGQAASAVPGVGGWWSGVPWLFKAAAGGAAVVAAVALFVAMMLYQGDRRSSAEFHAQVYKEHSSFGPDDEMIKESTAGPLTAQPDPVTPRIDTDAETRHNEATELEAKAEEQLLSGTKLLAKDDYWQAAAIQKELAEKYPNSPGYRYSAAVDLQKAGDLEADVGTGDAALAAYTDAQGRLEKLVEEYPDQTNYLNALATVYESETKYYMNASRQTDADEAAAKATKLRDRLKEINDKP